MNQVRPIYQRVSHARKGLVMAFSLLACGLMFTSPSGAEAQTYGPWPDTVQAPAATAPAPFPRPIIRPPYTGYTNDGTLFMGGQMIGNPHQILHDIQNQALFDVQATRLTDTTDPTFGQGSLAQMETHMTQLLPTQSNELLTRLYVSPVNPYPQTPIGTYNNFVTYDEVIANTQQASYQLTVANDNNLWAFKTLAAPNSQAMNILIKELPAHQNFIANSDPMGGAVGVKVNSNGDAAALQNYFATTKPYDFTWRSALGPWASGLSRPNNINAAMGNDATAPIGNGEAGAVFFNWVMESNQVQHLMNDLNSESHNTGNETFGVLAWDSNQNNYVMLSPTEVTATSQSVSGSMPLIGSGQTAFYGIHTHVYDDVTPSLQDIRQASNMGFDQIILDNQGASQAIILPYALDNQNNQSSTFTFNQSSMTNVYGPCSGCGQSNTNSSSNFVTVTASRGVVGGVPVAGAAGIQGGFYITINKETAEIVDVGVYTSTETGTGLGIGKGVNGGVTFGSATGVLQGKSGVVNVMTPWGSVSINYNEEGQITGISASGTGLGVTWGTQNTTVTSIYRQNWATSADTYNSVTGDSNHAPGTDFSSHVNGFV